MKELTTLSTSSREYSSLRGRVYAKTAWKGFFGFAIRKMSYIIDSRVLTDKVILGRKGWYFLSVFCGLMKFGLQAEHTHFLPFSCCSVTLKTKHLLYGN